MFHQIRLFWVRQTELIEAIEMVHHVQQRGKAAIVEEAALMVFLRIPQRPQRRRPVPVIRRPVRLETVDPDFCGCVLVPARLGEERRHVAARAVRPTVEELLAAGRRGGVEGSRWAPRRRNGQLIEVKGCQLGSDPILRIPLVPQTRFGCDRELRRIIQDSRVFGRLRKEVMFAFTSKYALALYEMGEKRRNMQFRWTETFALEELRELLGVRLGELTTFGNFNA